MRPDELRDRLNAQSVSWDDLRERHVLSSTLQVWQVGQRRRKRVRLLAVAAMGATALIIAGRLWWRGSDVAPGRPVSEPVATLRQRPAAAPMPAPPSRLTLPDGSVAVMTDGGAITLHEGSRPGERLVVRQSAGRVRYEVRHDPTRSFVVSAGGVDVRVVGTVFWVALRGDQVRVSVDEGVVRVEDGSRHVILHAGDDLTTRRRPMPPARPMRAPASPAPSRAQPPSMTPLAAADAARKAGNLDEAVSLLRSFIEESPGDPRVPSALFNLGSVEMRRGRAAEAAAAFRRCRDARPNGSLAEDAAAEEAQAWHAAADARRAQEAAIFYLRTHPRGTHARAMQELVR